MRKWDGVKTCEVYKMRISVCAFLFITCTSLYHICIFDMEKIHKRTIFGLFSYAYTNDFICIYKWIDFKFTLLYMYTCISQVAKWNTEQGSNEAHFFTKKKLCAYIAYIMHMWRWCVIFINLISPFSSDYIEWGNDFVVGVHYNRMQSVLGWV